MYGCTLSCEKLSNTSGELKDHLSGKGQIDCNSIKTISFVFSLQKISNYVLSKLKTKQKKFSNMKPR